MVYKRLSAICTIGTESRVKVTIIAYFGIPKVQVKRKKRKCYRGI